MRYYTYTDKSGGSAFPHKKNNNNGTITAYPGMTLRDYFAGQALIGMLGTSAAPCLTGLQGAENITAESAYKIADAMLKAREAG